MSKMITEGVRILRISPYSVLMRENTDQNNSEYGRLQQFYQKTTPTEVFSWEYCNFFKNTCFEEDLQASVSAC